MTSTTYRNKYAGQCHACGHRVPANGGLLVGSRALGWGVQHLAGQCPDEPAPTVTPQPKADAEAGFYVRGDEAFKVQWNLARTHTYAKRFVISHEDGVKRASWEYAPGVGRDLAAEGLTPMTAGDAARIGLSHGFCVNCCRTLGGVSLSAHVSALIGYGETCAKNNGWPYPTGVAAQREFVTNAA